ncbi:MAG: hypothetical protein JWP25_4417 [Bradyrhizobium sp.]|nr:hypothetical protein [Bradyrhizobium sp.]
MKTMTTSLLFVGVLASILFLVVLFLTGSVEAAKGGAAFTVAALPSVSSWLEQVEAKRSNNPGTKMTIRSFDGFAISLLAGVAVGTIVGVAITNIASFFSGMVVGAIAAMLGRADQIELLRVGMIGNIPIVFIGFYLLGRWLGSRSPRNGLFMVVLSVLLTAIANRLLEFLFVPPETWKSLYQVERNVLGLLQTVSVQFAVTLVPTLVGFWRGRKMRTSKYMGYLLSALPEDTQNSLVDLAFEEVKQKVKARRSVPQPSAASNLTLAP